MGIFVTESSPDLNHLFFIPNMPTAATVPRTVATTAFTAASTKVFFSACIAPASRSISTYQYREKPVKLDVLLEALKENATMTKRGRYISTKISAI